MGYFKNQVKKTQNTLGTKSNTHTSSQKSKGYKMRIKTKQKKSNQETE